MEQPTESRTPVLLGIVVFVLAVGLYAALYGLPALSSYSGSSIGWGILAGVILITMFYTGFTDPLALYTFLLMLTVLTFVLYYFGYISWSVDNNTLDINLFEKPPAPSPTGPPLSKPRPLDQEVFFVSNNIFTYDQAPAVCAAYGARLASYDEIESAYNAGGEWCGYGWSQGGIALFPTQEDTWNALQKEPTQEKRQSCGRPGINGGYFDPAMKFGVNCYGVKPKKPVNQPHTPTNKAFSQLVQWFKQNLKSMTVAPFDKSQWSESVIDSARSDLEPFTVSIPLPVSGAPTVPKAPAPSSGGGGTQTFGCPPDVDPYAPLVDTPDLALRGTQPTQHKFF
jgi:hypothetical protein